MANKDPVVQTFRHPGGWCIAPVHYSMDPRKDGEWVAKMKARGTEKDWLQEMEINFSTVSGVRCFENFSIIENTREELEYNPLLPLRLACDFNVNPMAWVIAQIHDSEVIHFIDEIFLSPGDVASACDEFLDMYGDHAGEVIIYGDASGRARSQRDQRSNYDEMQKRFMNRPFKTKMRVPRKNPSNVNNVRSMNWRLKDVYGKTKILVDRVACPYLIKDLTEVVWDDNGKQIKKSRKPDEPYFYRTHCADAAMALVYRHFPTRKELNKAKENSSKPLVLEKKKKKRLLGAFQ